MSAPWPAPRAAPRRRTSRWPPRPPPPSNLLTAVRGVSSFDAAGKPRGPLTPWAAHEALLVRRLFVVRTGQSLGDVGARRRTRMSAHADQVGMSAFAESECRRTPTKSECRRTPTGRARNAIVIRSARTRLVKCGPGQEAGDVPHLAGVAALPPDRLRRMEERRRGRGLFSGRSAAGRTSPDRRAGSLRARVVCARGCLGRQAGGAGAWLAGPGGRHRGGVRTWPTRNAGSRCAGNG